MSSARELQERIAWLERELPPNSHRYKTYDALPFAILRYDPDQEWLLRREVRLLATRLAKAGLHVETVSMADFLWNAIEQTEGLDVVAGYERERGFIEAQRQVNRYLSDPDFRPLAQQLAERLAKLNPAKSICLLTRAAAFGPSIYSISSLLEQMQGRTEVPTVLFYPGHREGTNVLRFLDLSSRDATGSYRVKIYG